MVKKNKGYAMVIVLIVITVLFLLSASLSVLINGKISLSANNFERINAKYNAETGIEEGVHNISNKTDPTGWYPGESSTISFNEGNYKYNIQTNGSESDYKVTSYGYYPPDENEKVITVLLNEGDYEKSFIYGNQFYIQETMIDNVNIPDYFSNEIDFMKYDPTDLYREFLVTYYFDGDYTAYENNKLEDNTIDYTANTPSKSLDEIPSNPNYYVKKQDITDENGDLHTFYAGQVYHYQDNLNIEGHSQTEELSTEDGDVDEIASDDPTLVVVDGDLTITDIQKIEGFIFIVNGNINYNVSKAAKPVVSNTFFYSGNDFYYNKDVGNLTGEPHLDLDGQIIVENNINFKIKANSSNSAHYKKLTWPTEFDYADYKKLYKVKSNIISWDE